MYMLQLAQYTGYHFIGSPVKWGSHFIGPFWPGTESRQ